MFKNYLQTLGKNELGVLTWLSVSKSAEMTHSDLLSLVEDTVMIPPGKPTPGNAFKRACAYVQEQDWRFNDKAFNLEIKDLGYNPKETRREFILIDLETRNRISLGQVICNKKTGSVAWPRGVFESFLEEIRHEVDQFTQGQAQIIYSIPIRQMIVAGLKLLDGLMIKEGLYFLPPEAYNRLGPLADSANKIPGVNLHLAPLAFDSVQQNMILDLITTELDKEMEQLEQELYPLLDLKAIPAKTISDLYQSTKSWESKLVRYSETLKIKLNDIAAQNILTELEKLSKV